MWSWASPNQRWMVATRGERSPGWIVPARAAAGNASAARTPARAHSLFRVPVPIACGLRGELTGSLALRRVVSAAIRPCGRPGPLWFPRSPAPGGRGDSAAVVLSAGSPLPCKRRCREGGQVADLGNRQQGEHRGELESGGDPQRGGDADQAGDRPPDRQPERLERERAEPVVRA